MAISTEATYPAECIKLALEGERWCRSGDFRRGVEMFLKALDAGTDDITVLSAIYIQLGNAYYYLEQFEDALEYHSRDLAIARSANDEKSEARASGNVAATLKSLGHYEEALVCAQRQLELYRKLRADSRSTSKALYNLASVLHAKGKAFITNSTGKTELPESSTSDLLKAAEYYLENYVMAKEMHDVPAQGRVCGNLGNIYYLLGDFAQAVVFHKERLTLAKACRDAAAERRAYTNLGNCHIFLCQYSAAEEYYLKALALVDSGQDRSLEAQMCYSLANTYSLKRDYKVAVEYFLRHMAVAKDINDSVGEARACWSLGAAYAAMGDWEKAIFYGGEHLRMSEEIGDSAGYLTAQANLIDYRQQAETASGTKEDGLVKESLTARIRRISMEHMEALRMTHESKVAKLHLPGFSSSAADQTLKPIPSPSLLRGSRARSPSVPHAAAVSRGHSPRQRHFSVTPEQDIFKLDEDFFEFLTRAQAHRLDDQRCSFREKENTHIKNGGSETGVRALGKSIKTREELMDYIAGIQGKRLDEQRAELPLLPLRSSSKLSPGSARSYSLPISTHQIVIQDYPPTAKEYSKILEHSVLSELMESNNTAAATAPPASARQQRRSMDPLPDSFFDMLMKHQSARLDDQRASISIPPSRRPDHPPRNDSSPNDTNKR